MPTNLRRFRQFLQKLELGRTRGGNNPCAAMLTDRNANGGSGLRGRGCREQMFRRENFDVHKKASLLKE